MRVCLDTSAYSQLRRGNAALQECLEQADGILLPVVVVGELHAGFLAGSKVSANLKLLAEFLEQPGVGVQDVTREVAERYGLLVAQLRQAGTPIPTNDIWIAATALETGTRLVAYDGHFAQGPGLVGLQP